MSEQDAGEQQSYERALNIIEGVLDEDFPDNDVNEVAASYIAGTIPVSDHPDMMVAVILSDYYNLSPDDARVSAQHVLDALSA